jgi:ABC-type nitrate/sulfonate/bicarbonate transport system ATPase subunit
LENEYLRSEVKQNIGGIVGKSPALQKVLEQIDLVAPVETSVSILGETGTGKELVARAIHERSKRKTRALVKVPGSPSRAAVKTRASPWKPNCINSEPKLRSFKLTFAEKMMSGA